MKRITLILFALFTGLFSFGQTQTTLVSHYVFPGFTQGEILFTGGGKDTKFLNYNAITQEMVFDNGGKKSAIAKDGLTQIDTIYIKGRKFVPQGEQFMEVVHHSSWDLYAEYKCSVKEKGQNTGYGNSQTASVNSVSSLISNSAVYDLKLPSGYDLRPSVSYWLKTGDEMQEFDNVRQLKKLYKDKKDAANTYTKENKVDDDNLASIIKFIDFLESN